MSDKTRGIAITVFASLGLISGVISLILHYLGKNELDGVGNFWGMTILSLVILVLGIRILVKAVKAEKK